jgi:hypothetical protein
MFSRTLTLVLAATAAAAFAGSAQAAVIDTDSVELNGTGYDFGNSTFIAGSPTGGGDLEFDFSNTKLTPRLEGTMHVNDADGTCARMRLQYKDASGDVLATEYGGTKCVEDDQHHEFSVDLDPYADDSIASVKVSVQKQTATGWSTVDSSTYEADTHDDNVKITEDGVDFGSSSFGVGAPTGSGEIDWDLDDGDVTPRLTGSLHLNNSSGVCARVNLRYLTEAGTFLTARAGGSKCADDNGHHSWSVDLDPHTSNKIGQVRVQLQTQGNDGSWNTAGSDVVSIAE